VALQSLHLSFRTVRKLGNWPASESDRGQPVDDACPPYRGEFDGRHEQQTVRAMGFDQPAESSLPEQAAQNVPRIDSARDGKLLPTSPCAQQQRALHPDQRGQLPERANFCRNA